MIGFWISFVAIGVLFSVGIIYLRYLALKKTKIKITPKVKRHANATTIKLLFFYWSCDLFYMSCFENIFVCKYIFGGIVLIIIFVNLATAFTLPIDKRSTFGKYGMIQDFLVGIGLTIYLIYIIPNISIQEIVIPVVAAIYGGLITLVGVAWTIKKAEKDRRDDEIKKARPVFSYNMLRVEPKLDFVVQKICLSYTLEEDIFSCEAFVELENSNLSSFEIKRIHHDHNWIGVEGNKTVLPGTKCLLTFRFSDNPEYIILEVEDILKNKHYYQLKVLLIGKKSSSGKFLHTIREINEISEIDANKLIAEEPIHSPKNRLS